MKMQNFRLKMDIHDLIKEEDLTPDLSLLADVCGMEIVKLMMKKLNGQSFYIPKITRLKKFVRRYVMDNPKKSLKVISMELGVTQRFLNDVLANTYNTKSCRSKNKQY